MIENVLNYWVVIPDQPTLVELFQNGSIFRIPLPDHPRNLVSDNYSVTGGIVTIVQGSVKGIIPSSIHLLSQDYYSNIKVNYELGCALYEIREAGVTTVYPSTFQNPKIIECINLYKRSEGLNPLNVGGTEITDRFINGLSQSHKTL